MRREITVKKGQPMTRLSLIRELIHETENMFELEENPDALGKMYVFDSFRTVSKHNFKATLIIEIKKDENE